MIDPLSASGQVRKAGCPLSPCWYAVRAAAYAGSSTSGSSRRGRSRISSRTAAEVACRTGYPGGSRRYGAGPPSGPPSHRACPPAGRCTRSAMRSTHRCSAAGRLVHLQLLAELKDPQPDVHRTLLVRRRPAGLCLGGPPGPSAPSRETGRRVRRPVSPKPAVPGTAGAASQSGVSP
jgi:hypothetical protein